MRCRRTAPYAIETEFPGDGNAELGDQMFPDGNAGFVRPSRSSIGVAGADGQRRPAQLALLHKMADGRLPLVRGARQLSLQVRRMATIVGDGRGIDPDAPTVLTIKVLYSQPGLPIAEQGKQGRAQLFGTSFAQYERAFRAQLGDMFAPGGFDPRRDVAGIILNRWGHAYVSPQPGFFFGVDGKPAPRDVLARSGVWEDCVCEYGVSGGE
jgi:hypothetical protein